MGAHEMKIPHHTRHSPDQSSGRARHNRLVSKRENRPFDRFLLALIGVYQRRISPRKGWRCAHSALHAGPGCSGFARQMLELNGWRVAAPLVRARFRECKAAAHQLRAARIAAITPTPRRRPSNPACLPDPDCLCCAADAVDCAPGVLDAFAAFNCHAGVCECFGCL